jgi:hypothetical protein
MAPEQVPGTPALSEALIHQLATAIGESTPGAPGKDVLEALNDMCAEAHARKLPPEAMVLGLRTAWLRVGQPIGTRNEQWSREYSAAVDLCLRTYFSAKD